MSLAKRLAHLVLFIAFAAVAYLVTGPDISFRQIVGVTVMIMAVEQFLKSVGFKIEFFD